MAERGKRAGNRGSDFRPSKGYAKVEHYHLPTGSKVSPTALMVEAGIYYECCETEETAETHLVPRRSLTSQQGLKLFDQEREYAQIPTKILRTTTGELVNPKRKRQRITWRSDKTLLRRNIPDQLEDLRFPRITAHSKRKDWSEARELPAVVDVPIDVTLDRDIFEPEPEETLDITDLKF